MSWGPPEEGIHLGHLVRTFRFLLADLQGKARVSTAQEALLAPRETVQSGTSQGLQVAVQEPPQGGTAQETGPELQDWKGTGLAPLVETAQESQDQVGTHQVPREALDTAPVLQDPSGMGTDLEPPGQRCHQGSRSGQRAGPALPEPNRASRGS